MNWRQQAVALLAHKPTEWLRLADVFDIVEFEIPVHAALRHHEGKVQSQANRGYTRATPEVSFHTARWNLFVEHVRPLVERRSDSGPLAHITKRTDSVRLRPDNEPCATCGGPRYLAGWPSRGENRKYSCPVCVVEHAPTPEPTPEPTPPPEPAAAPPTPEPVSTTVATPEPEPESVPPPEPASEPLIIVPAPRVIVPPKPRVIVIRPLEYMSSLEELWDEFEHRFSIPKFQDNSKLRRALHRAFEAGAVDQYHRLRLNAQMEALTLGVSLHTMRAEWRDRALQWINKSVATQLRPRWTNLLMESYGFAAQGVVKIFCVDRMDVLQDEMDKLTKKLFPPPKPVQPVRQRWTTMVKGARNVISHWRMK